MIRNKPVQRVIDVKNSQAFVKYTDGTYSYLMTQFVPKDLLRSFYAEKRLLSRPNVRSV